MADYAKGLPDKRYKGHLSELPTDTVLTLVRQLHNARRAGKHTDLRIGTPSGLYSWAVPKDLPVNPGEKRLAITQPIHRYSYKDFEGTLPPGYGEGTVEKLEESPVVLLKNSPNHIIFTRGTSKDSPIYSMVQTKNGNWIVSIRQEGQPTAVLRYKKEHFSRMPIDQIADVIDHGAKVRAKIDGASTLLYLGDKGIRAFGTRIGANGQRPEYTDVIGNLRGYNVPEDLRGKLIRGELYGMKGNKVIHPSELSALLHSNLTTAIDNKQKKGIRLLVAALAENKNGVDDYWTGADDIAARLGHPAVHGLPAVTGDAAKKLIEKIRSGKYPLTREGVVVTPEIGRPIKAKNIDDYDVVIRDIFKADTDKDNRAGGFVYSLPDSEEPIGRVGTGFSHSMLRDMLNNPDSYIGRIARIHSQEQLPSGAFRAPGFIAMKAD